MITTYGSLFAGIGGFDLGFDRAGLTCKWQVEIDEYAPRVLERHWPDVRRWGDIRTFPPDTDRTGLEERESVESYNESECPSTKRSRGEWEVDVICGGFPCQDISYAGAGAGLDGERSGLFWEAMRVIRQLEPRVVVLENVAALLTRGLSDVLGTLASLGYDAQWHCIQAVDFGAPHIRDRVFIIANRQGERFGEGREGRVVGVGAREEDATEMADTIRTGLEVIARESSYDEGEQQAPERNGHGRNWWSVEPNVGRVAHGVPSRVDRLRGLGNAVVPQIAEWIGRRIIT